MHRLLHSFITPWCTLFLYRASKDYQDMHGLIMHSYNFSHSPDLRVDHLGFHKALCVLMGWNYEKSPDNNKGYQRLSPEEAQANREDLILWPPCVIIHNTNFGRRTGGRTEGFGNKDMDNILRGRYNYMNLLLAGVLVWTRLHCCG